MKNKYLLLLIPALLLSACGTKNGGTNPGGNGNIPGNNPNISDPVLTRPTAPLTGYYQSVDYQASGTELLSQVREVTVSKHRIYTSYAQCTGKDNGGYYHKTDVDPNNKDNLIMFYSRESINQTWSCPGHDNGFIYNREHVWPKSNSANNWNYRSSEMKWGGADLHHIRPAFNDINGDRGNLKFGIAGSGARQVTTSRNPNGSNALGGYIGNGVFEPLDCVKGDVARILLYMLIHYNTPEHLENVDNLKGKINSPAYSNGSNGQMALTLTVDGSTQQAFDLMKSWNESDPVDQYELTRNEEAAKIQGNRNPFIDHPWLVEGIWG